jgi:hypothetical protein
LIFARNRRCPLCEVERTLCEWIATSEFDPKATLPICSYGPCGAAFEFASELLSS